MHITSFLTVDNKATIEGRFAFRNQIRSLNNKIFLINGIKSGKSQSKETISVGTLLDRDLSTSRSTSSTFCDECADNSCVYSKSSAPTIYTYSDAILTLAYMIEHIMATRDSTANESE